METMTNSPFMVASKTPVEDIAKVAYEGQDPKMKMYHKGYEVYMNNMYKLDDPNDPMLQSKLSHNRNIMSSVASSLKSKSLSPWVYENLPEENGFDRTIIAVEAPQPKVVQGEAVGGEGSELVVARWGDQKSSPVHGHSTGFLHEDILFGKMRVNTYRMIDPASNIVRPLRTDIVTDGVFLSKYTQPNPEAYFKRQSYIHNFTSIGQSVSLHYVPEHTRDGRDNGFVVEYFEDFEGIAYNEVTRITAKEGLYSRIGDVILVRSLNVPEYGDHFIVITGHPVVKEHGLRPQDVAIQALPNNSLLNRYDINETGVILLKLNDELKKKFHEFHGITIQETVIFPEA